MSLTLTYEGTLTVVTCWCGMAHAVPEELRDYQLRQHADGKVYSVYCPLGHTYIVAGKSQVQTEREARQLAERQRDAARVSRDAARDQAEAAERRRRAAKGQLTKVKRRVANGVCPCCNRSFADVARHMTTKHPDYAATTTDPPGGSP